MSKTHSRLEADGRGVAAPLQVLRQAQQVGAEQLSHAPYVFSKSELERIFFY